VDNLGGREIIIWEIRYILIGEIGYRESSKRQPTLTKRKVNYKFKIKYQKARKKSNN